MAQKAVAKKTDAGVPAAYDYGADAGAGSEQIDSSVLMIPFVGLIQSNSPQLKKSHEKHLEGAQQGMFFNGTTGELYPTDGSTKFIVAGFNHYYVEFVPRDEGGGFVGQRDESDPVVQRLKKAQGAFGKLVNEDPEGTTELSETYAVLGVVVPAKGEPSAVVIPCTSTKITPFKAWMTTLKPKMRALRAPIFAFVTELHAVESSNKEGDFWKPKFLLPGDEPKDYLLDPTSDLFAMAKELYASIEAGKVGFDVRAAAESGGGGDDEAGGDGGKNGDDPIPF